MSYHVNNTNHNIVITMANSVPNLKLKTYINGDTTSIHTYTHSNGKFTIPMSDYSVGDTITKFELVQTGSPRLWNTHEGVQILLNGKDINATLTNHGTYATFPLTFDDTGDYDIQAVYVGNGSNQACRTTKEHFIITEPEVIDDGVTPVPQTGKYVLRFKDKKIPTTMTYADGTKIAFQLTKGGVPVANRNVQVIMADGSEPYTKVTGNHGIVYFENGTQCKAGKWKIGAYYYDEDRHKTISSGYKTITINKLKPKITDNFVKDKNGNDTNFIKGSKYVAYLEYDKKPIKNAKLDLYINGKKTTKTTSMSNGAIAYAFKTKNTYQLKVVYKGDDKFDKVELSRKITITE